MKPFTLQGDPGVIGYVIIHPESGYLTNYGDFNKNKHGLFLIPNLTLAKKLCKKFPGAKVQVVTAIGLGKIVFRSK